MLGLIGMLALGACGEGVDPLAFLKQGEKAGQEGLSVSDTSQTTLVQRDVEAPEVFDLTAQGLWDGRPSLGGVWVAHADVNEPERVIIRNTTNSKFVIGALFRRERDNPGPPIQVSSEAAEALGMLAGAPAMLNVTALRREAAPEPDAQKADSAKPETPPVKATALDPVASAAAAIDKAEAAGTKTNGTKTTRTTGAKTTGAKTTDTKTTRTSGADAPEKPATATAAQAKSLEKPYIQIGIFSVEKNARNTATAMRQNGMVPIVRKQTSRGKTFWRVIVGPATNRSERSALLDKIKAVGFTDAYPVTN